MIQEGQMGKKYQQAIHRNGAISGQKTLQDAQPLLWSRGNLVSNNKKQLKCFKFRSLLRTVINSFPQQPIILMGTAVF